MEMNLKKDDIEKLIKKEFGESAKVVEFEKLIIDVDIFSIQNQENRGTDNSFHAHQTIKPLTIIPKEDQKLTLEQEKYIRFQVAKHGGGKELANAKTMQGEGNRNVEDYDKDLKKKEHEKKKSNNVYIDKKHGTIIDGVK